MTPEQKKHEEEYLAAKKRYETAYANKVKPESVKLSYYFTGTAQYRYCTLLYNEFKDLIPVCCVFYFSFQTINAKMAYLNKPISDLCFQAKAKRLYTSINA